MERILLYENVDSMVKAMPRIEALYYFVYELAECFHAEPSTLSVIEKGILENQILNSITLLYKDSLGNNVGKIVISIDWDKHFLLVNTDEGKMLEFDLSKSIVDNVVGWRKIVVTHIDELIKQFNVSSVEGWHTYREHLYGSEAIRQKTRELLGTSETHEKMDDRVEPEFQKKLGSILEKQEYRQEILGEVKKRSFGCGAMEEVSLDIYYKV